MSMKHPYYETPNQRDRQEWLEELLAKPAGGGMPVSGSIEGRRVLIDGTIEHYTVAS
jgi:hypothetical protein